MMDSTTPVRSTSFCDACLFDLELASAEDQPDDVEGGSPDRWRHEFRLVGLPEQG